MKAFKERKKPGRRPMSPTSKKAARRAAQVKFHEKMKRLRKEAENQCQPPVTRPKNPSLIMRIRMKNKTFGEWRSLSQQLGVETDDLMASFLLNIYWAYIEAGFSGDSSRILNKIKRGKKKSRATGVDKTEKVTHEVRKPPDEQEFHPVKKENITDGWTDDCEAPKIPQDPQGEEADPHMVHNREDLTDGWTLNSGMKEACEESQLAGEYSGCHTDPLQEEHAVDDGSQETILKREADYETFYIKEEPLDCDYGKDCDSGGSQSSGKSFQCLDCNITFSLEYDFTEHMKTHSSRKTFQCTICQVRFLNHDDFQKHMKIHADQILYNCSF